MSELYLFDGYNILHAGGFRDARELRDALASWVALRGARGIVVFDGMGDLVSRGPLEVRYAPHADTVLERLAAEHRGWMEVVLVTSGNPQVCGGHRRHEGPVGGVRRGARPGAARRGCAARARRQARRRDPGTFGTAAARV